MNTSKVWNGPWTQWMCRKLARWTLKKRQRLSDTEIWRDDRLYLDRWYIIPRNPLFNIYLHRFMDSDPDDAHHDHPWWSLSFMLSAYGGTEYYNHAWALPGSDPEVRAICLSRPLRQGDVIFRSAKFAHRIELESKRPIVTLFITGPRFRRWGFNCPEGWKFWKDYVEKGGCGE